MVKSVISEATPIKSVEDPIFQSSVPAQVGLMVGKLNFNSERRFVYDLIPAPPTDGGVPACSLRSEGPPGARRQEEGSQLWEAFRWRFPRRELSTAGGIKRSPTEQSLRPFRPRSRPPNRLESPNPPPPPVNTTAAGKMLKPAVVYLLLVIAFVILLSFCPTPHAGQKRRHGRRLVHHHTSFEPLVEKLEQRADEQGLLDPDTFQERLNAIFDDQDWRKVLEIGAFEEYFSVEGRLNVTERLTHLFPLLDRYPEDGKISFQELEVWNRRRALDRLIYRTERRMKLYDKDGDGAVTLEEFLSHLSKEERDWDSKERGKPGWWKEQFLNADKDGNGSLDSTEFRDFLHPEDSRNPAIQLWLQKEKLREMDQNEDGKLSFMEFRDRFNDMYLQFASSETDVADDSKHHQVYAERKFGELDVNKDRFLTVEELKPIVHHLQPGEFSYAMHFTKYLMRKADDDKDGKLTLKEMLNHHQAFYSVVFEGGPFDDYDDVDDDYDIHDELR